MFHYPTDAASQFLEIEESPFICEWQYSQFFFSLFWLQFADLAAKENYTGWTVSMGLPYNKIGSLNRDHSPGSSAREQRRLLSVQCGILVAHSGFTGRSRPVIRKFVQYLRYFRLTSNLEQWQIIELANHWPSFKIITQIHNLCQISENNSRVLA